MYPELEGKCALVTGAARGFGRAIAIRLAAEGVEAEPTSFAPEGLHLKELPWPLQELPAYREGLFQVQGEAAQICTGLLEPRPGERILDLCCGLGGKTTQLAELTGDGAQIVGLDSNRRKLVTLTENVRRLGIRSVLAAGADVSRNLERLLKGHYDRILLDAPCSALGTIARHPDAKWSRDEGDVARLAVMQRRLLQAAVPLLKPGGRLLYVTCTLLREENEQVVADFLGECRGAVELLDARACLPAWGHALVGPEGFLTTWPHLHGMEGFFAAVFAKKAH